MRAMKNQDILTQIGHTPLVRLTHIGRDLPTPILVKCEHLNPSGSIKDRAALSIVDEAEKLGKLRPGMTLIEATAGNTGASLALIAAVRGYNLVCVMPEKMSIDKRKALRLMGAQVIVTPNVPLSSPKNFRNVAQHLARENGWYLTNQFENPANIRAHEETTAQELLDQVEGPIGAFVSGSGTGGTITGVSRRLKSIDNRTLIVLADPIGSGLADWIETGHLGEDGHYEIEGIGSSKIPKNLDRTHIDCAERISDQESFAMVHRLISEEGLYVGGSAGANLVAAVRIANRSDLIGPVVTVMCDSWDRYRSTTWMNTDP
jgi:cysteine synthase